MTTTTFSPRRDAAIHSLRRTLCEAGAQPETAASILPENLSLAALVFLAASIRNTLSQVDLLEEYAMASSSEDYFCDGSHAGWTIFAFEDGSAILYRDKGKHEIIPNLPEWVSVATGTWSRYDAANLELLGVPAANIALIPADEEEE